MNRSRRTITLLIMVIVGLVVGTMSSRIFTIQSSQAQQVNKEVTRSPKWEYCAITGMNFTITGGKALATIWIRYFQKSGTQLIGISSAVSPTDPVKDEIYLRRWTASVLEQEGITLSGSVTVDTSKEALYAQVRRDALAKAIAKLGEEGWEMLGPELRNLEGLNVNINMNPTQTSSSMNNSFVLFFKRSAS